MTSDAQAAAALFQRHRDELGFVNVAQCREKDLYVERRDGGVVGAALCNHCVRKPQTTLYDIAVDDTYRRRDVGTTLRDRIVSDSPHDWLVAKCPSDLQANHWYRKTGWRVRAVHRREGKRTLVEWEYDCSDD
jgi:ribosomal protein S18 acetylase RimI-like enzyme